ncbi:MAG: hypothetical protein OXD44_05930 [Gammaproteobacteria bacterium]|nr:hypothetical protein [Gammaproteobacteria bacterium]
MISLFLNMCLFRAKPEDLPVSKNLLMHCIAAATVAFMIRNIMLTDSGGAVAYALIQGAMLGISLYLFLKVYKKTERWLQAASALYGCSAFMVAIALPILAFAGPDVIFDSTLDLTKILVVITSFWYFIITVFILKETLEIGKFAGFGMAILLEVMIGIAMAVMTGLMGTPVN